jgi:hypothetical protein
MTEETTMASKKDTPKADEEQGFKDVTDAPADEVAQEMAVRASAQSNGGGPWPPEVLQRRFVGANRMRPPEPVYTSHENTE